MSLNEIAGMKVIANPYMRRGTFALMHDGDVAQFVDALKTISDLTAEVAELKSVSRNCPICWITKKIRGARR